MNLTGIESGQVEANGCRLYVETRGEGSPLLLIAGGLADAGQFTALAEALAPHHRVITYDRRGNSRSTAPTGWATTNVAEQADDAVGLLQALGIPAASVYGHSLGAPIALEIALRRPEIVDALILHDPVMVGVLADPGAVMALVGPVIGEAMESGGPAAAAEAFYRFAVGEAFDALDSATWERMRADGPTLFGVEFAPISEWLPGEEALRRSRVSTLILAGTGSPPFFHEAAGWLAPRLGAAIAQVPGGHGAAFDHPADVAKAIAAFPEGGRT